MSVTGGYHGHTGLALAAETPPTAPFGPNPPGFTQVVFDDLDAMAAAVDERTAVVLVEPIPATLGMPIPSPGYLAGLRTLCDERGALLAFDEVQTGLGRTGTVWYHVQEGVTPDLLVTGKGLSGGVPITATPMTAELHRFFDDHPFVHVSTFGAPSSAASPAWPPSTSSKHPGFSTGRRARRAVRERAGGHAVPAAAPGIPWASLDDPAGGMTATQALVSAGVFATFANNDPSVCSSCCC